jgi:hypothetical protein
MKNIHLIPTDKPSRLAKHSSGSFHIVSYIAHKKGLYKMTNQHIYITNDEEIKEGNYGLIGKEVGKIILTEDGYEFLIGKGVSYEYGDYYSLQKVCKKIILTTDPDLIKDGVQAIDDTFLEWFVKNPSCESVEVVNDEYVDLEKDEYVDLYKIIIPQEEPKKEVTGVDDNRPKPNYCYAKEQGYGEIGCVFPACHCGLPIKQEEPLQETFEEAAERESQLGEYDRSFESTRKNYFIKGAKWQQERMYIDIEVFTEELKDKIDSFEYSVNQNSYISDYIKEWFEQFKKK